MGDLDELPAMLTQLRELITQAHAATRDARLAIREAEKVRDSLPAAVVRKINDAVKNGLEEYDAALIRAIEEATSAVWKRFDRIEDLLFGEDKKSIDAGQASLEDLLKTVRLLSDTTDSLVFPLETPEEQVPAAFRKKRK